MVRLFCLLMIMLGESSSEVGSCTSSALLSRFTAQVTHCDEMLALVRCSNTDRVSISFSDLTRRRPVIRPSLPASILPQTSKPHKTSIDGIRRVHRIDWQHSRSVEGRGVLQRGLDVELSESFVDPGRLFVGVPPRKGNSPPTWSSVASAN